MEQLVPIEDVAKHFNVSLSTARKWVRDGAVPSGTYVKIGKTQRFDLERVSQALMSYKSHFEPTESVKEELSEGFDPTSFDPDVDV
jgi:transposase